LMIDDGFLERILDCISSIPHVQLLRIHSRIPTVFPQRITPALIKILTDYKSLWFVTHFNHSVELSPISESVCRSLVRAGIPILNQTVLLSGVNDTVEKLEELMKKLVMNRIKPYYLHILDPAPGTAHFRVTLESAIRMVDELRKRLPGYAVPLLVQDQPGQLSKIVVRHREILPDPKEFPGQTHIQMPGKAASDDARDPSASFDRQQR
jgi:lysine 2,3-aminomutase